MKNEEKNGPAAKSNPDNCRTSIRLEIDGAPVLGWIVASRRSLSVEIVEPFSGVCEGRHIPIFAASVARFTAGNGALTPRGHETAAHLLHDLFAGCRFYNQHRRELCETWSQIDQAVREEARKAGALSREEFLRARAVLRRHLRAGLACHVYACRLKAMKRAHLSHELIPGRVRDRLLEDVRARYGDLPGLRIAVAVAEVRASQESTSAGR